MLCRASVRGGELLARLKRSLARRTLERNSAQGVFCAEPRDPRRAREATGIGRLADLPEVPGHLTADAWRTPDDHYRQSAGYIRCEPVCCPPEIRFHCHK